MIHSPFDSSNFDFEWSHIANPAVATDLSIVVPVNARCELVQLSFNLVTDANVADRHIFIYAAHGARDIILGTSEFAITANQSRKILVGPYGFSSVADSGSGIVIATPPYPVLLEGDTLSSAIIGLQAADQISDVEYVFKTWIYEQ